ncbi:putative protein arginine N-methyltransferase [Cocos nucifera]|nr:putative protein arginine N-methyltransferase [Cocos nucifera]
MPLGQRVGDKSDSRYCGVETEFNYGMPQVLTFNLSGGFDFVMAPLIDPSYRPNSVKKEANGTSVLPVAASDLILGPSQWSSHVVGKISSWIDLDSEDEELRLDSEITLKQEIAWASHLSLQACLLPPPRSASCGNYARCVNQILQAAVKGYLDAGRFYRSDKIFEQVAYALGKSSNCIVISGSLVHNVPQEGYEDLSSNSNDNQIEELTLFVLLGQYQRAICKALLDRVPDEEALTLRMAAEETGRKLKVYAVEKNPNAVVTLHAAEETGRKLKVYAVEKNPNAVVTLHSLIKLEGWEAMVTIVSSDMRCWDAPEKADILVSELLGSFGDNELSPECLDGAQRFLKPDGISIPSSYTSFIQPVTTAKLYNDVKSHRDLAHFETAYVVKLHRVARLAPSQPLFSFKHPEYSTKKSNQRYKKLRFEIPLDTGSAMVHGFAGYFDATLYQDVHLGIEPSMATPNMFSWFPIFFPLRTPLHVPMGSPIEVHFWRCCAAIKVWYEWCVTSPSPSPVHNSNGRSYWAAEETGRKLKVYAVEKNPNAVVTLHSLIKLEGWEAMVTIVSSDMRCWDAPEKADILVSELLGSFGDNELSPECLDGAQRFLKPDGISIPSSYTSFIQPVTTAKLYNDVKSHRDLAHFETAYVVKLHRVARLAPSQPLFSFKHPEYSTKKSNQRYKKLRFEIPLDTGSAMVHGFAGYFDATLYQDVHLGIEPSMATPNMFSWSGMSGA